MIKLLYITNDIKTAKEVEAAGADRIFVDLEKNGKTERQGHLDTFISDHQMEDVNKLSKVLTKAELLVRINPYYEGTAEEVEKCIEYGADIIMLPMFKTALEVEAFIKCVAGRCKTCLLLERIEAVCRIDEILQVKGIDEIHIGLNDLHLSCGLDFMFELLSGGMVEYLGDKIKKKNIDFGFGGIARIGEGDLPAEMILGEHYRLHSKQVILSRKFRADRTGKLLDLNEEINKIREVEKELQTWDKKEFKENQEQVIEKTRQIVKLIRKKKQQN